MELQFYGANCLRITTKKASIVVDDNLADLGQKSITKDSDISLHTHKQGVVGGKISIDKPGEYEISGVSIRGVAAKAHIDEESKKTATIYKLIVEDIRLVIAGHIDPKLNDEQLEALGTVDVLVVPVGNSGYTLDAIGAQEVIKSLEPSIIIPTHFAAKELKYHVPQVELSDVLKSWSMDPGSALDKLKLRSTDIPDQAKLVVLNSQ